MVKCEIAILNNFIAISHNLQIYWHDRRNIQSVIKGFFNFNFPKKIPTENVRFWENNLQIIVGYVTPG